MVVDPLVPELFVFDRWSGLLHQRTLIANMLDVFRAWYAEEGSLFEAGGSKVWITDLVPIGEAQLAMAVAPANVIQSGRELWRVNLTGGQAIERFTWAGPEHVGRSFARVDSGIVTLGFRDGGVYRYRFPEGSGWSAVGRKP